MVNRTHQIKTDENETELTLRIGTESNSPLAITETRHRDSHELRRKTISSGKLVANSGTGEKIVTTFEQFTIAFAESDCTFDNGTLTVSFFAPGANEASKILKLEATNANYTVIDITNPEDPTILNDFEGSVCNLSDFKI
jgi:hypothetical protein